MGREVDLAELVGREPDERLLDVDAGLLPDAVGRPEGLVRSSSRGRIVAVGATLTGVTLIGGLALLVLAAVEVIRSGVDVTAVVAFVLGLLLVGTHWGWVHVAEATADAVEARSNVGPISRRREWLAAIEPYTRWSVSTRAGEDGSITIVTERFDPVPIGSRSFTFSSEVVSREVHVGDEPAAVVTERAELLRRRAAASTERARELYAVAHDAYQRVLLARDDEAQRLAAVRAASEALSEQINTNLRDPPVLE